MLLGIDGQAHYNTAQLARKWTVLDDTDVTWTVANEGRWGGTSPCIKRVASDVQANAGSLTWAPVMNQDGERVPTVSGVCGFAIKVEDLDRVEPHAATAGSNGVISIWEGETIHCWLGLNKDGTFTLGRGYFVAGGDGIALATSIGALSSGTWAYVECKWLLDVSAGSFVVRVNGLEVLNYSGRTTSSKLGALETGEWSSVQLLRLQSEGSPYLTVWLSDFYLADLSGSGDDVRDFLGDMKVLTILPNGAGASSAWTPNSGANWAAVDDVPADDDTSYVSTAGVGNRDSYAFTDIPTNAVPIGFQSCHLARTDIDGAAVIQPTMKSGATTADGPAQGIGTAAAYAYKLQPYDTNPVTGVQATAAEINAAEFGTLRA